MLRKFHRRSRGAAAASPRVYAEEKRATFVRRMGLLLATYASTQSAAGSALAVLEGFYQKLRREYEALPFSEDDAWFRHGPLVDLEEARTAVLDAEAWEALRAKYADRIPSGDRS